jgi:hypothetical protein
MNKLRQMLMSKWNKRRKIGNKLQGLTTRILLIRDEKFLSRITKKPSQCSICDGFRYRHGLSVMDWSRWRFPENHHRLMKSVTILYRHHRAQSPVSPTQIHLLWQKNNRHGWLPHHHVCLRGCLHHHLGPFFYMWADISKLGQMFFFGPPLFVWYSISYTPLNLDHLYLSIIIKFGPFLRSCDPN